MHSKTHRNSFWIFNQERKMSKLHENFAAFEVLNREIGAHFAQKIGSVDHAVPLRALMPQKEQGFFQSQLGGIAHIFAHGPFGGLADNAENSFFFHFAKTYITYSHYIHLGYLIQFGLYDKM